ncbi:MAG: hypothetical protein KDK07_05070 [Bauldia sp.]|nr:hypothetical protein [Bauldia sp.]
MLQTVLVGLVAGLAAALLFVSPLGGTLLALPLFVLSALPIAIAGLAWSSLAGAIAAATAAVVVAAAITPSAGAIHLSLFGAPMAWACRLVWLSRDNGPSGASEWFPIGRILFQATAIIAVGVVVVGFIVGYDPETLAAEVTTALVDWLAQAPDASAPPSAADLAPFVRLNVAAMPFTVAAMVVIIFVFDLWLAARIAEASGRLSRPRDRLWTAVLPKESVAIFAATAVAAFVPGVVGYAAGAVAGAFGGALALIGLAFIHATTLQSTVRILLLVAVYVVLVFFGGLPLILLALLGIAETFFHVRARRLRGAPPTT